MKPKMLNDLCEQIKKAVVPPMFKSEYYMNWLVEGEGASTKRGSMYKNSKDYSSDDTSGEWKLAMTLGY